jgi:hypothetical protein
MNILMMQVEAFTNEAASLKDMVAQLIHRPDLLNDSLG